MSSPLNQRRNALFAFFLAPGLALASWVTRTPQIRDSVAASVAEMGAILFGLSLGSMAGILLSGRIVSRVGTRHTALFGLSLVTLSLAVIALGSLAGQQVVVSLGLGLFGLGMGTAEIAINMDGAEVERQTGAHLLHTLHGCFSLGTLLGALLGLAMVWLNVPVAIHLLAMTGLLICIILAYRREMPVGYGIGTKAKNGIDGPKQTIWRDSLILLIGVIVFAMAMAEGSANDWLPILVVDAHGFSQTAGSLVFVAFAAAMSIGRFGGGPFLRRLGAVNVLRLCALVSTLGIAYVVFGSNPFLVGVAVFFWGIGCALGFPVALSAAAAGHQDSTARVEAVATIGYLAMLVGPPALGFVGEHHGLRGAMLIVMAFVVIAFLLATKLRLRSA